MLVKKLGMIGQEAASSETERRSLEVGFRALVRYFQEWMATRRLGQNSLANKLIVSLRLSRGIDWVSPKRPNEVTVSNAALAVVPNPWQELFRRAVAVLVAKYCILAVQWLILREEEF